MGVPFTPGAVQQTGGARMNHRGVHLVKRKIMTSRSDDRLPRRSRDDDAAFICNCLCKRRISSQEIRPNTDNGACIREGPTNLLGARDNQECNLIVIHHFYLLSRVSS
jgi:hypothetical protein